MLEDWRGVHTPGSLYEYQNKGLTKFSFRKLLILKDAFSIVAPIGKRTGKKKKWQQSYRTPKNKFAHNFGSVQRERKLEKEKRPKAAAAWPHFSLKRLYTIGNYGSSESSEK